jgi:hypothetical protein
MVKTTYNFKRIYYIIIKDRILQFFWSCHKLIKSVFSIILVNILNNSIKAGNSLKTPCKQVTKVLEGNYYPYTTPISIPHIFPYKTKNTIAYLSFPYIHTFPSLFPDIVNFKFKIWNLWYIFYFFTQWYFF